MILYATCPAFAVSRTHVARWFAAQVFADPPCSCQQGICTTCAGFIREGTRDENYKVAVDALGEDQRDKVGFPKRCSDLIAIGIRHASLLSFLVLWRTDEEGGGYMGPPTRNT